MRTAASVQRTPPSGRPASSWPCGCSRSWAAAPPSERHHRIFRITGAPDHSGAPLHFSLMTGSVGLGPGAACMGLSQQGGQTGRRPPPSPPLPAYRPSPPPTPGTPRSARRGPVGTRRPSSPSAFRRSRTGSMASLMMSARSALDGGVQGHPLAEGAGVEDGGLQLRHPAAAAVQGGDKALLPGLLHHPRPYRPAPRRSGQSTCPYTPWPRPR